MRLVQTVTGLNRSCNRKKPMWTGPHRFGPVFSRIQKRKDRLRLRSMALGVERPDRTGLPNTTQNKNKPSKALRKHSPRNPYSCYQGKTSHSLLNRTRRFTHQELYSCKKTTTGTYTHVHSFHRHSTPLNGTIKLTTENS